MVLLAEGKPEQEYRCYRCAAMGAAPCGTSCSGQPDSHSRAARAAKNHAAGGAVPRHAQRLVTRRRGQRPRCVP